MEIVFLPPAKGELTEAISYYNDQSEGLGYEFARDPAHRGSDAFKQRTKNMEVAAQEERTINHGITTNFSLFTFNC